MQLTCVTAVFNAVTDGKREALVRCARSVALLKVPHEHLFVDGASTDGTLDILRELQAEIPTLKVISERDTGIYNALNKSLKAAEGEWFHVLGCDDFICAPEVLDDLLLKTSSGRDEVLVAPVEYDNDPNYAFHKREDLANVLRWIYGYCHQGMLVKTALMRRLGGFNETYQLCADGDMILKLHERHSRFRYTYRAFANFASGGANERKRDTVVRESLLILQRHLGLSDAEAEFLSKSWLPPVRVAWRHLLSRDLAFRIGARWILRKRMDGWFHSAQSWLYGIRRHAAVVYNASDLAVCNRGGFVGWIEPIDRWSKIIWMDSKRAEVILPLPPHVRDRDLVVEMRVMIVRTPLTVNQTLSVAVRGQVLPVRFGNVNDSPMVRVTTFIPRETNAGRDGLALELELSCAPVPLDTVIPGCPDPRPLGMCIMDIALYGSEAEVREMNRIPHLDEKNVLLKRPPSACSPPGGFDVTVVTVVFNAVKSGRAAALCECLDSVQKQVGCSVEHVVIDGASDDGTSDLVRDYVPAAVPLRFFSAPDSGIYEAMNRGIALSRGTYVVFLNSDDCLSDPNGLAVSVRELATSGADFSYAPAVVVDERGSLVPHAFSEGRPFQLFAGMTLCHQTMLTRRKALLAQGGFDVRYRSAADYDLLLRMVFTGYRACRVGTPFVTFRLGGFSAAHADVCDRDVAQIYARLFNRHLGMRLTEADGLRIRRTGIMPEALACQFDRLARRVYGDWYRLSEAQSESLRNLLAGRLQERALPWCRRLRCPSVLNRLLLSAQCRRSPALDKKARTDDLDFLYCHVQRVQAVESGFDVGMCVELKSGLVTSRPLDVCFVLNDGLRDRAVRIGLLLQVVTDGRSSACAARISCGEKVLARIGSSSAPGADLVDIAVPSSCNVGERMRLRIELVGGWGRSSANCVGAVLVYGGLVVSRKVA